MNFDKLVNDENLFLNVPRYRESLGDPEYDSDKVIKRFQITDGNFYHNILVVFDSPLMFTPSKYKSGALIYNSVEVKIALYYLDMVGVKNVQVKQLTGSDVMEAIEGYNFN